MSSDMLKCHCERSPAISLPKRRLTLNAFALLRNRRIVSFPAATIERPRRAATFDYNSPVNPARLNARYLYDGAGGHTMTTTPQQLHHLQELDHRVDGIDAERNRIEKRLAAGVNRPDLTSEAEHHSARAVAVNANANSRREEGERIRERLIGLESRLYSGNTSRRDLSAIQREVDSSKYQLEQLDELLLELETEQRTHEDAAVAAREEMESAAVEWQNIIETLGGRLTELEGDREAATCQRQDMAVTLPQADLQRYERLRRNKAGTAVALVDNGRVCLACRMTLTSNVLRQLRDKTKQVPCSTCGRILFQQ